MTRPALLALVALLSSAAPLLADDHAPVTRSVPMTAEEFDAYTLGRTLSYAVEGTPYGIEQYLPDRHVRWTFIGDQCQDGIWYEKAGSICFAYDNNPTTEQCWRFYAEGDRLRAVFQGPGGPSTELYEVQQSDAPLGCLGPGVGV